MESACGISRGRGLREDGVGNAEDIRDEAVKPFCMPLSAADRAEG
jgi:hypothetical protein